MPPPLFHGSMHLAVFTFLPCPYLQLPPREGMAQPFYFSLGGSSHGQWPFGGPPSWKPGSVLSRFPSFQELHSLWVGHHWTGPCGDTGCPPFFLPLAAFEGGHHLLHQLLFTDWGSWQPLLSVDFEVEGEDFFFHSFGADQLDSR